MLMKLYKKEGNVLQIISFPNEHIEKGDYLLIEDKYTNKSLIAQVIDVQFASVPGIFEELLRSFPNDGGIFQEEDIDPLEIAPHTMYIQDTSLLICKIRATFENKLLNPSTSWLPSRSKSIIKKLPIPELLKIAKIDGLLPITLGKTKDSSLITIDATSLDGRLNIITGKKGCGKSHMSKLLMASLIDYKAIVVIFDLNGEYSSLGLSTEGKKNRYFEKIHELIPAKNFKVSINQLHLNIVMGIMIHALNLPGASAREFRRIWKTLRKRQQLTLYELGETIRNLNCNQHIRDALSSRYHTLVNSGFFTHKKQEVSFLDKCIVKSNENGGAIIINLKKASSIDRQIIVEFVLGKLVDLLACWKLKAVFLFAEEAHLYLRETYWDDIVTRMRHFGIFTTFITNQPDTIKESIYRQADNIFLFNFTNDHDLDVVSRAARVDAQTVRAIAIDLPPQYCLTLGKIVEDFPIVTKVKALDIQTLGKTRLFF
jgi:DNA helicase HerA-like ATPase